MKLSKPLALCLVLLALILPTRVQPTMAQSSPTTFAVIGDYGMANSNETEVANLVKSWDPAFIVTTGDDYYDPAGGSGSTKYDNSIGRDYCPFLGGITTSGKHCPQPGGSEVNRFFPALGNHDYRNGGTTNNLPTTYTDYFNLPGEGVPTTGTSGNERYYDVIQGPVHFFFVNSVIEPGSEPDGTTPNSKQGTWLKNQLAASSTPWQIVLFHNPPYSSGKYGNNKRMQWPFAEWGADVVISGDDHHYERISRDGIVYFVNGTGGGVPRGCGQPISGSQFCLSAFGAQRVTATGTSLDFEFISIDGKVRDTLHLEKEAQPTPEPTAEPTVEPTAEPTAEPTTEPTAEPPAEAGIHVGDLDRTSVVRKGAWVAKVTVSVHDEAHNPVAGVVVTGKWDLKGAVKSCTTKANGTCLLKLTKIPKSKNNVTLTITKLVKDGVAYMAAANHDVDSGSNGTSIKVNKK